MEASWTGLDRMPRLTIKVVAPAGGWGSPSQVSTRVVIPTDSAPLTT